MPVLYQTYVPCDDDEGEFWRDEYGAKSFEDAVELASEFLDDSPLVVFVRQADKPEVVRKFEVDHGYYCNVAEQPA